MVDGSDGCKYDVFISYSRKDVEFARRLQRALAGYAPAKDLPLPQRRLRVFRDESDFQGTEYRSAVEHNLRSSGKLLVISSPHSRASEFVGEEIGKFAELRGEQNIASILLSGVPNNQPAAPEAEKAFHDELVARLPIPLAADYRGCGPRDRVDRDRFETSWYKVLADIYADYGVDRNAIEQREKLRQRRSRRIWTAVVGAVALALASLTVWALISRQEAIAQRNTAQSRFLASQSMSAAQTFEMSLLLAAAAYRTSPTAQAWEALFSGLQRQRPVERFLHGHAGVPSALAVSDDGGCAAGAANRTIVVWDLRSGRTRAAVQGLDRRPTAAAFASGCSKLVAGFEDGDVEAWKLEASPTRLWAATGHDKGVTALAVDTGAGWVAAGHDGGRISMHGLDSGKLLAESAASSVNRSRISVLKFDARNAILASVDWHGTFQRWKAPALVPTGEPLVCLGSGGTGLFALSSDLSRCASGASPPGPATITDLTSARRAGVELGGPWILALDFTRDGRLITGNQGGMLQLWDLEAVRRGGGSKPPAVFVEHRADVTAVVHNPADDTFVSAARDQSIIVWRPASKGRLVDEDPAPRPNFEVAAFDSSLQEIVAASAAGDLFRSKLKGATAATSIGTFGAPVTALVIREDSGEVFAGTPDGSVIGLQVASGKQRRLATGHKERIERLRLDSTGLRLAAVAENGTVSLWNLADDALIAGFPESNARTGRRGGVTASVDVAFEPGGDRVASIHGAEQAFLWQWIDAAYRFDPFPLKPTSYFTSVAFSPDRHTVALGTGIYEGGIALFDALNAKPASAVLSGHDQLDVTGLAFSPDARLLLSGGFDRRINVWDVAGRRRIGESYLAAGAVKALVFAKTGTSAAAVTERRTVVRLDFDPASWLAIACRIANRDLTAEESARLLGTAPGVHACPVE